MDKSKQDLNITRTLLFRRFYLDRVNITIYLIFVAVAWTGDECETDVDECLNSPCTRSNAEKDCENTAGGYDCHCIFGYTLPNCDSIRNFCDEEPCLNSANCTSINFVGKHCSCFLGFEGKNQF